MNKRKYYFLNYNIVTNFKEKTNKSKTLTILVNKKSYSVNSKDPILCDGVL